MTPKQIQIIAFWEDVDAAEPTISTEALIARVCGMADCTLNEVMDALAAEHGEKVPE